MSTAKTSISTERVKEATGKSLDDWFSILDSEDATKLSHKEIAELLYQKYLHKGWWCQMVTVEYERAKGLRKVHQKSDGFSATVSKTLPFSLTRIYEMWSNKEKRSKWLPEDITITSETKDKYIHFIMPDMTKVTVGFYSKGASSSYSKGAKSAHSKGDTKSMVALEHNKLKNEKDVQEMKQFWKTHLEALRSHLR